MTVSDEGRKRLGAAIAAARAGRTMSELYQKAGVSPKTWSKAEAGLSVRPDRLAAIGTALGWTNGRVQRLLTGEQDTASVVEPLDPDEDLMSIVGYWGSYTEEHRRALLEIAGSFHEADVRRQTGQ